MEFYSRRVVSLLLLLGPLTPALAQVNFQLIPVTSVYAGPGGIANGPDGAFWFAEPTANKIGRMTTGGLVTNEFVANGGPASIVAGPDGAMWFVEKTANQIGRMTTAGVVTNEYPIPTAASGTLKITVGSDGALWFTENAQAKIGRVSTGGVFAEYSTAGFSGSQTCGSPPCLSTASQPHSIVAGGTAPFGLRTSGRVRSDE